MDDARIYVLEHLEDQLVSLWHDDTSPEFKSLANWMGFTEDQYLLWVECRWSDLAASLGHTS